MNAPHEKYRRLIEVATALPPLWVIPTNEELMIARHTRALLPSQPP